MNEIQLDVWIDAPRQTVFDAIASREGLDGWWGPVVEFGNEAGETIAFDHVHGEPLRMRIVEFSPGARVEWECVSHFTDPANPASEWLGSRITFELAETGPTGFEPIDSHFKVNPITILRFRHSGWPADARWMAFCAYGWGVTLVGLEAQCKEQTTVSDE
jgi:uncharacterized protein YndB with AHSA1/START domain